MSNIDEGVRGLGGGFAVRVIKKEILTMWLALEAHVRRRHEALGNKRRGVG